MATKTKKVVKKSKAGRPSKYEAAKVSKLEAAFHNSFTVEQACLYAGIGKKTFFNWLEKKPGFLHRMTKAREHPNLRAKEVVINSINNGNSTDAKWWLERKQRDEFAPPRDDVPGSITNNFITLISKDKDEFSIPDHV